MTFFDLRAVRLRSGEEYRDEQQVEISPLVFGGLRYVAVPEQVPAELAVTRATTGTVFELRLHARLHGPCYRCLGDAVVDRDLEHAVGGDEQQLVHHRLDAVRSDAQRDLTHRARPWA
jgi:hypothetical protein